MEVWRDLIEVDEDRVALDLSTPSMCRPRCWACSTRRLRAAAL